MRKTFDVEDLNLDDLITTAMEDVDSLSSYQIILRGVNIKHLLLAYREFCKDENVSDSPIDLKEVILFYNQTLADLPSSIDLTDLKPPGMSIVWIPKVTSFFSAAPGLLWHKFPIMFETRSSPLKTSASSITLASTIAA